MGRKNLTGRNPEQNLSVCWKGGDLSITEYYITNATRADSRPSASPTYMQTWGSGSSPGIDAD